MAKREFKKTFKEIPEVEKTEKKTVKEKPEMEKPKKKVPSINGIVTGCERLNVRKSPKADAEVITIIDSGDKVTIDYSESTNEFYKIFTTRNRKRPLTDEKIEGFCMKKFIKTK